MAGLIFNSLVCLAIAGSSAEVLSQSRDTDAGKMPVPQVANLDGLPRQADSVGRKVLTLVEPVKEPLVVELGRSRLLHFPAGIRRTAVSNADVSDAVQVGPKDVLVLGRKQGVANFTVWPASDSAGPSVIVVRVSPKQLRRN